ncbi:MAG: toxin-antitoxin system YwqK family antitoxin [Bacteroidales bacterium]|nr:toxin-antitoxin system YwqK family antitoxin [Bacteroidales bacterium]
MLKRNLILFICLVVVNTSLLGQTDSIGRLTKFYYESGKISSQGIIKDNKPDGFWQTWYENGNLKSEGLRTNFLLDSIWNFYYEDGKLHQKISYRSDEKNGFAETWIKQELSNKDTAYFLQSRELFLNGTRQGESFYYHENGELKMGIYYRNNKRHGSGKEFDQNGNVIALFEYFNGYLLENKKINRHDAQGRKQGTWMEFYENGQIHTDISYMYGKIHGYYREYNDQGILIKEMRYLNGELITREIEEELMQKADIKTLYNENGSIKYTGAFLNEKPVGIHREYNENGELNLAKEYDEFGVLLAEGLFDSKGNKTGRWTLFYETGEIMARGQYKDNKKHGNWEFLYQNGKTEQKGEFVDGRPEGEWIWYYDSGEILREENYHYGKREGKYQEFDEEGNTLTKGEYFDGYKMGEWFYNVGDHTEIGNYENGFQHGKWKHYYLNDKLSFEGEYKSGDPSGKHTYYYENGDIFISGLYRTGKKHGTWKRFNADGTVFSVYKYRNGNLLKIDNKKINDEDADIFKEEIHIFQH